jgi:hypothetical protein
MGSPAIRADAPAAHEAAEPQLRDRYPDLGGTEGTPAKRPRARGAL